MNRQLRTDPTGSRLRWEYTLHYAPHVAKG